MSGAAPASSVPHAKSQLAKFQLENGQLWQPQGKSHETWVCHLTWTLLQHVDDPTLRDCHSAAYHKSQVAELLLPYVFGQLAIAGQTDVATVMQMSEQLSRYEHPEQVHHCSEGIQAPLKSILCCTGASDCMKCHAL